MSTHDAKAEIQQCSPAAGIHVVAKPMGPMCNLACDYCFYLEKKALFGKGENYQRSDNIISAFTKDYILSQPTPVEEFVWQGGEPTLAELDEAQARGWIVADMNNDWNTIIAYEKNN